MDTNKALKIIWSNEPAIRENLLKSDEVRPLLGLLIDVLEREVEPTSIIGLRYRKFMAEEDLTHWWSDINGYPTTQLWSDRFEPLLSLLEQHKAQKTLKARFKDEDVFIQVRSQGEDLHIIVGERDGTPGHGHIIIDGKSGEIRVEYVDVTDGLVSKIVAVLTLGDGKQVQTVREVVQNME